MRISTLILCFLLFIISQSKAQNYPIKKYTPHDGLAQMQVYSVLKDSRGIVWAATGFGLSCFNGEAFTNYTAADGLVDTYVNGVHEDKKGYLWAGSGKRGVTRFDGKTFKKYPCPKGSLLRSGPLFDDNGEVIFGREDMAGNRSLLHVVGDTLLPYHINNMPKDLVGKPYDIHYFKATHSLIFDFRGSEKLYSYHAGQWTEFKTFNKFYDINALFDDELIWRATDTPNAPAITTYFSWNGKTSKPFIQISLDTFRVFNVINHDFFFTVGSKPSRLYYLPKGKTQADFLCQNPPIAIDFYTNQKAEDETLWIPTEKGLWQLTRRGFKQFEDKDVPYCWGVVEDKNHAYYFLNYNVSLQKYDGKQLRTVFPQASVKSSKDKHRYSTNGWYYKPLKDKNDNIWLPCNEGVFCYDYKKWHLYSSPLQTDNLAFSIAEDARRDKIVVVSNKHLYTVGTKAPHTIEIIKDTNKIFSYLLLSVVVSPKHDYWFAGKGIGCYNSDTKKFKYYTAEKHTSGVPQLPTNRILGVYSDWQGTLWAMTWRDGVLRYNPQKDIFERVLDKYFTGMVNFIEQIDDEHLLFGNLYGIHVFNLKLFNETKQVEIKTYNQHNGFMGIEAGQLGSFRDSKGYIWITSGTVLSRMNPKELNLKKQTLCTFITKIGNERMSFLNDSSKNFSVYHLPDGQNTTTFTVEAISEDKPLHSQFSFRIKGVFDEWSEWQEQNLLMVNNLPNGEHTIEVRSRLGNLETSEYNIASQKFYVAAPTYKSPNFYKYAFFSGLALLSILAYFWWLKRKETQRVNEQKRLIEKQENEANAQKILIKKQENEVNEQKRFIETQENKVRFLQVKTIQAQMNPHFTFNVLGTLQFLILNNETKRANENLGKLSSLIRNYLEASLLNDDETGGSLFKHEITLEREIYLLRLYIEFEQLQYTNRFDYTLTIDSNLNPDNYRVPPFIIQPFVENAIKHGLLYKKSNEKGNLKLLFKSLDEDTLFCTIEDDGVGREEAAAIQAKSLKQYKSRGSELVKKRVEILNEMGYDIEIKTKDSPEGGTVVSIKISYK